MLFLQISFMLIFTYLLSSLAVFKIMLFSFKEIAKDKYKVLLILSLGISPMLISWFLEKLMIALPYQNNLVYQTIIVVVMLIPILFFKRKDAQNIKLSIKGIFKSKKNTVGWVLYFIFLMHFLAVPLFGNDAMQYHYVASVIYKTGSFNIYPLINNPDYSGYFPWTHPTGYIGLITWSSIIQGTSDYPGVSKFINIFYAFISALLLFTLFQKNKKIAFISSLSILLSPLYIFLIAQNHIDAFRIFFFFIPFVFLSLLKDQNLKNSIFVGLLCGLSMHSHSLGIIALPLILFIIFIQNISYPKKVVVNLVVIIITSLMFVIFRYYLSFLSLGYFLGDNTPIWNLLANDYNDFLRISRDLETPSNRILNGILKPFTRIQSFGYIYIFILISSIYFYFSSKEKKYFFSKISIFKHEDKLLNFSIFILLSWFLVTIISSLLGFNDLIKNDRYTLTIYLPSLYILLYIINFLYEKNFKS